MKNLKSIAIVALFIAATSVSAQDKMNKPTNLQVDKQHQEDDHLEKFKDQLNLTPEQKAKIKAIRAKRFAEKTELKKKLKDLRVAERIEINSVLTDEQRALVKEKKEMKHENIKKKRPSHK
ncbi:MAG: Spy/CpxP family protein refolding chaperone [Flavobacteriales bacterium]|nr:Spy/CpxP family protein refolding chaperone [Flavobacteriales bacterium]MCB9363196.1 Spy/CpxP family protein refolding chaperone [Flavobacteriales bacterium]